MDADSLVAEGEKKLKSLSGFLSNIFGSHSSSKQEEAAELFVKAANKFKFNKRWSDAGQNYQRAADLYLKTNNKYDASVNYVEASTSYRKVDPKLSCQVLEKAVNILTDMGRHYQTMAEVCEQELLDNKAAIKYYEKAVDIYQGEDATSSANKCQLRVAELSALAGDYSHAIEVFEEVAKRSTHNNLLRYSVGGRQRSCRAACMLNGEHPLGNGHLLIPFPPFLPCRMALSHAVPFVVHVKDHLFRAGICQLCVDALNAQMAANRYVQQIYSPFADTREYKLILALSDAVQHSNEEDFKKAIHEFDKVSRLDGWCSQLLLLVQKRLEHITSAAGEDDNDESLQ